MRDDERGGIVGLYQLLRDHSDAVEADLLRFYPRLDLLDFYRIPRTLSLRRLAVVLRHLPADSATGRLTYGEYADWTGMAPWLLADLFHAFAGSPSPRLPQSPQEKKRKRDKVTAFKKRAAAHNNRKG